MRRRSAWISRGFEELVAGLEPQRPDGRTDFDVVIVGTGYGGAIAAAELAGSTENGRKISVCVLERGKEYLPGMFPARLADAPGHVRFSTEGSGARGRREGLFDFRIGSDVSALVANGLGGGSLINAGVMEEPAPGLLADWVPGLEAALRGGDYFDRAKRMLGAADAKGDNDLERHPRRAQVSKHAALERLAGGQLFRKAAFTIAMETGANSAGVERKECLLCGDCATGCNYEAKDSLDTNLLVKARRRGARIYCGATVLRLARQPRSELWTLDVVYTDDPLRKRQGPALQLRARHVVLAAGTYGTTEILLRSRGDGLEFSPNLGQRFSANGDAIAVVYHQDKSVGAVADERVAPLERKIGPTITGIIDRRTTDGCLIEELAIPAPVRRAFEEVVTTTDALRRLADEDPDDHGRQNDARHDPSAVDAGKLQRSSILAMMGHDGTAGSFELDPGAEGDSGVRVRWPGLRNAPVFDRQQALLERLAPNSGARARVLPNPLWQLLPDSLKFVFEGARGPAFTVHPLGGCPIGQALGSGAVDEFGQVFKAPGSVESTEVWPRLAVLDGSIVRSSLGTNPALTIAALALRAVENLRGRWGLQPPQERRARPVRRPEFSAPPETVESPVATRIEILERMSGVIRLAGREDRPCVAEISLRFKPVALEGLFFPPKDGSAVPIRRELAVLEDVEESQLRVFDEAVYRKLRRQAAIPEAYDGQELLRAPLSGRLSILHREPSAAKERRCRGFRAFMLNRGLRDAWQWAANAIRYGLGDDAVGSSNFLQRAFQAARARLQSALRLATRAGEVRLLQYELKLGNEVQVKGGAGIDAAQFAGQGIRGTKRLTYGVASNPWRQLMRMQLEQFPQVGRGNNFVLDLDTQYLVQKRLPLFRIVAQQDQPTALADVAAFGAYFLRLLLNVHVWSFRRPDAAPPREPQRLPGVVPGMNGPEIRMLELDHLPDGTPVAVRLARYRPGRAAKRPVVLIHGYSASGTTFAHPALHPGLADYLYKRGRDVWVVDLRTSSGMPTARHPWAFEDAALADIPAAIDRICEETGSAEVDLFAHCMGSAMFSMAILSLPEPGDRFHRERLALPRRVRRAVLSQISPYIVMTPANLFRGYAMNYLRLLLPLARYDFRVPEDPGLAEQLMDRLLATLPYPEYEFRVENPRWPCKRTPFVGTRHRMDALYGRDFSLADEDGRALISDAVLKHIDDFFGPLSIETVSQGIHFARAQMITDSAGNGFPKPQLFRDRWTFPTLSMHGEDNGLPDVATQGYFERMVASTGIKLRTQVFPGFGHQDSLIGKRAAEVFREVHDFLEEDTWPTSS